MIRKVNRQEKTEAESGNGSTAVAGNGVRSHAERRAGSAERKAADARSSGVAGDPAAGGGIAAGRLENAARPTSFTACIAKWCRASTKCWTPSCCPIGEGNRILAQISDGKIDELIAQTYKGDHEKMKLAVNNVATVAAGPAEGTDAARRTLPRRGNSPSAASPNSSRAPMRRSCAA